MTLLDTLKWTATGCLIVGFGGVAAGFFFMIYLQMFGGFLWLAASVCMKDRPLIVTNAVMSTAGVLGLLYQFIF
jgi:hypothetical protein